MEDNSEIDINAMAPNRPMQIALNAIKKVNSKRGFKKCAMVSLTPFTCGTIWCCSFWPPELTAKCQEETINKLVTVLSQEKYVIRPNTIEDLRVQRRLAGKVEEQVKLTLQSITTAIKDQSLPLDYKNALIAARQQINDILRPTAGTRLIQMLDSNGQDARDASESRDGGYQAL